MGYDATVFLQMLESAISRNPAKPEVQMLIDQATVLVGDFANVFRSEFANIPMLEKPSYAELVQLGKSNMPLTVLKTQLRRFATSAISENALVAACALALLVEAAKFYQSVESVDFQNEVLQAEIFLSKKVRDRLVKMSMGL